MNSTSQWEQIGLVTDVIFGSGLAEVAGLIVMPWCDLTENVQIVGRYQLSGSNADDGIRLQRRYERKVAATGAERGDLFQAAYFGVNFTGFRLYF